MNSKLTAAIVLALMFIGLLAPLAPVDETDALTSEDYSITIPGTAAPDENINVTLGNGKSSSWTVYVVNQSKLYLDVTFTTENDCEDIVITDKPKNGLVVPENETDHDNILSGTFTFGADSLSGSYDSVIVKLVVAVTDINDKESTIYTDIVFNIKIQSIYDTSGSYNKFFGIFENKLPEPFNSPWVPFLATIAFWMIFAEILTFIIAPRLAKFLDKKTTDDNAKRFENGISKLIAMLVLVASFNQSLRIIGAEPELISDINSISFILYTVLVLIIAWKVYLIIIEGILTKFDDNSDSSIDLTLLPLFRMIGKIIFWLAGSFAILGAFGVDLQGILVSAGVISLGITMGAQNVLAQFFSGIVILLTRPFKKGDFLKINDKVYVVNRVKVMFTEFKGWDMDQIITMPNNAVTASTIVNLSKEDEAFRLYTYYDVAYGVDLKKAEEVMLKVANESPVVLHDKKHAAPNVRMTDFGDSGIVLRLGVTIRDFNGSVTAGSALRMAVYQAFIDNDIEIPYNRLEVTMLNECFQGQRRPGDNVPD